MENVWNVRKYSGMDSVWEADMMCVDRMVKLCYNNKMSGYVQKDRPVSKTCAYEVLAIAAWNKRI